MEPFVIIGVVAGIYSSLVTAIYLPYRKEDKKGIRGFFELLKWLVWCGLAIFGPILAMQYIGEYYQLNLDKFERFYALGIWLCLLWAYLGYAAYISWKKGTLKIYGTGGKFIYKGRKNKDIS